jgi:hypothetical protein
VSSPSAAPLYTSVTKPRDQLGVDGRFLLPLLLLALVTLFSRHGFWINVFFGALTVAVYLGAKVQWESNPYYWDEILREIELPTSGVPDAYFDAPDRSWRTIK